MSVHHQNDPYLTQQCKQTANHGLWFNGLLQIKWKCSHLGATGQPFCGSGDADKHSSSTYKYKNRHTLGIRTQKPAYRLRVDVSLNTPVIYLEFSQLLVVYTHTSYPAQHSCHRRIPHPPSQPHIYTQSTAPKAERLQTTQRLLISPILSQSVPKHTS